MREFSAEELRVVERWLNARVAELEDDVLDARARGIPTLGDAKSNRAAQLASEARLLSMTLAGVLKTQAQLAALAAHDEAQTP